MSTTVVPTPQPAASGPPADLLDRYNSIRDFLRKYNVERNEEIDLSLLAMISGVDLLFLGDPGVGKTFLIELLTEHCITDVDLFTHLCAKDQSAGEILGERDPMALKQGRVARITDGMLPRSNFAYLDEIFKSSPPMLNPMLDIFAKRQLKVGGKTIDCSQLVSIFMSSNELPDREDLMAFRDRIAITKFVEGVKTPDGRRAVSLIQLGLDSSGIDTTGLLPLTLDEIKAIREQVKLVQVTDAVLETMGDIEQQCLEAKHPISQRRKGSIWRMVKAHAWARGGDIVRPDDFMIAEHMLWNLASDVASAHDIVLKYANRFMQRAAALSQELEPMMSEMDKLKQEIDAATTREDKLKVQQSGYHFVSDLEGLKDKARDYLKEGEYEGQDVSDLRDALAQIKRATKWTQSVLFGTDDEEEEDED
ncbi:MAG: AAA family ATPase [Solirubrobacteraceae bacterium]|jgi:MoxR-like ATPase